MDAVLGTGSIRRDVVVGVDGSADALRAVRWAAREARRRDLPLRVVVAHGAVGDGAATHRMSELRFREVQRRTAADAAAAAAAAAVEVTPGIAVEQRVVAGAPAEVLRHESRSARLLVLGDRGRGRLRGAVAGSVAVAVTTTAQCPVVVVRGGPHLDVESSLPVVLGVDGSATSEAATEFAFAAADARGVPLVAVHTWWDPVIGPVVARVIDVAAIEADERRMLVERLVGWSEKYPRVAVETVVSRDFPAHVLLRRATRAQLLVLGSRGLGERTGLVLGSVSNAAVHRAPCPVAVVRPDGSGRA
ncbi:universal stress protein [Pseudonocardia lacus]|uniref:universal stress protein n=1 Tax=Pseudonocardia lacus TaxID=2835865 RepID=UPI001BDD96BD|nr:universal stress protein [Pseudonocardia lacus]